VGAGKTGVLEVSDVLLVDDWICGFRVMLTGLHIGQTYSNTRLEVKDLGNNTVSCHYVYTFDDGNPNKYIVHETYPDNLVSTPLYSGDREKLVKFTLTTRILRNIDKYKTQKEQIPF
jgi:hypothetical protein